LRGRYCIEGLKQMLRYKGTAKSHLIIGGYFLPSLLLRKQSRHLSKGLGEFLLSNLGILESKALPTPLVASPMSNLPRVEIAHREKRDNRSDNLLYQENRPLIQVIVNPPVMA
jgi:hypothetical protein